MWWLRRIVVLMVLVAVGATGGEATGSVCWHPPVNAPVTDPFRQPSCRWCPGNRGIEYKTVPGTRARAVSTGMAVFVGRVAGVGYVVVRHADGRRATYGRLDKMLVEMGDLVIRGAVVGSTGGAFYFGLRDGSTYVDPAPFLGRLVYRPRLVPVVGAIQPSERLPSLRCGRP